MLLAIHMFINIVAQVQTPKIPKATVRTIDPSLHLKSYKNRLCLSQFGWGFQACSSVLSLTSDCYIPHSPSISAGTLFSFFLVRRLKVPMMYKACLALSTIYRGFMIMVERTVSTLKSYADLDWRPAPPRPNISGTGSTWTEVVTTALQSHSARL